MSHQIRCLVCKKALANFAEEYGGNQPDDGLEFITYGHYGSTEFDPMDGSMLAISICDQCLRDNAADILFASSSKSDEIYKPWKPPKRS